jgi:hypothetical protein
MFKVCAQLGCQAVEQPAFQLILPHPLPPGVLDRLGEENVNPHKPRNNSGHPGVERSGRVRFSRCKNPLSLFLAWP